MNLRTMLLGWTRPRCPEWRLYRTRKVTCRKLRNHPSRHESAWAPINERTEEQVSW